MNVSPYRRAYFALAKRLGLDEETRHAFNAGFVGKASTTDFTVSDWRNAVAELQRRAGQNVKPGRPRIKGRPDRSGPSDGITAAQLEYLSRLAADITWTTGLVHFIRARLLHPFRRAAWDGRLESLTRREAANVITALANMGRRCETSTA